MDYPMYIVTHRGLDPDLPECYHESTIEAFKDQLSRGYVLEFDINFARDGIIITHDQSLSRITQGNNTSLVKENTIQGLKALPLSNGQLGTFEELIEAMLEYPDRTHFAHFKGAYQSREQIGQVIEVLNGYPKVVEQLVFFDLKEATMKQIKEAFPGVSLAPSVAHNYDIKRYNKCVGGTLVSLDELGRYREYCEWVWLDEWDLTDEGGQQKTLCNEATFKRCRELGYKIALVTPELHASSPGLLGGESHPEASDKEVWKSRIRSLVSLRPDAVCTDHPDEVRKIYTETQLTSVNK